jgi:hypothetical protein
VLVQQARGNVIVAIREDRGGYVNPIAYDAARVVTAAVHLRLNLFDDDALSAFGRFHFVQFTKVLCIYFVWEGNRIHGLGHSLHLTEEMFLLLSAIENETFTQEMPVRV